jgi:hypothetical protein
MSEAAKNAEREVPLRAVLKGLIAELDAAACGLDTALNRRLVFGVAAVA